MRQIIVARPSFVFLLISLWNNSCGVGARVLFTFTLFVCYRVLNVCLQAFLLETTCDVTNVFNNWYCDCTACFIINVTPTAYYKFFVVEYLVGSSSN